MKRQPLARIGPSQVVVGAEVVAATTATVMVMIVTMAAAVVDQVLMATEAAGRLTDAQLLLKASLSAVGHPSELFKPMKLLAMGTRAPEMLLVHMPWNMES